MFKRFFDFIMGRGASVAVDLVEVVRPNAEAEARRAFDRAVLASAPAGGAAVELLRALIRPLFALGAFALFLYPALDPAGFAAYMAALSAMPDNLWYIAGGVVSFYFGLRSMDKRAPQGAAIAAARAGLDAVEELRARKAPDPAPLPPGPDPEPKGAGVRQAGGAVRPEDLTSRNNPALDRVRAALAAGG